MRTLLPIGGVVSEGAMKLPFKDCMLLFPVVLVLTVVACAQEEIRTSETSRTETCTNGVCSTTSSSTNTRTTGTSKSIGVGVNIGNQKMSTGGVPGADEMMNDAMNGSANASGEIRIRSGGATSGEISLNSCLQAIAPLNACARAGVPDVMMPIHLGCTDSGAHAWVCRDMMPSAPPYPVVACSSLMDSSCNKIGQQY